MKVLLSGDLLYWNPDKLRGINNDDILIVTYWKDVKEKYEKQYKVLLLNYETIGLGEVDYWPLVLQNRENIEKYFSEGEDIIILGDTYKSLWVYKALQSSEKELRLHLLLIKPFKFEGKRKNERWEEYAENLESTKTVALLDANQIISCLDGKAKFRDAFDMVENTAVSDLDAVVAKLQDLDEGCYFYDRNSRELININMEYGDEVRKKIEGNIPRVNGKELCKKLRELRRRFAEANNIAMDFPECPYEGPCAGTCLECDRQLRKMNYLINDEFSKVEYPHYTITEKEYENYNKITDDVWITAGFLSPSPRRVDNE